MTSIFVAPLEAVDQGLRIVAWYNVETNGDQLVWNWRGGFKLLGAIGQPIDTLRVQPPENPVHLFDYHS